MKANSRYSQVKEVIDEALGSYLEGEKLPTLEK